MLLRATTALAALAALVLTASAVPLPFAATSGKAAKSSCGTHPAGAAQHASDLRLAALLASKRQHLRLARADNSAATQARLFSIADQDQLLVPVKFFVMHSGSAGKVRRSQIEDQMRVLDEGFSGEQAGAAVGAPDVRVRFRLASVEYVDNQAYYKKCERNQQKIANAYVTEPDKYVHVIVCHLDFLGASTLPEDKPEGHNDHYIQLLDESLPGGNEDGANLGDTLVHEVGHYFGLEHTFEKGCSGQGDYVSDTPAAKKPNKSCKKVDSCPNKPGNDAVENFMDYTPDSCMDRFSPGQAWRMRMQLNEHKPGCVKRWTVQSDGVAANTTRPAVVAATTMDPAPAPATGGGGVPQHVCSKPSATTGGMWVQNSQFAIANGVCAASTLVGAGAGAGVGKATCHHKESYGVAAATCAANGARLCTAAELRGKVAAGSGCGMDGRFTWTGTACAEGFVAARGNGRGSTKCLRASDTSPSIRCCASDAEGETTSSSSTTSSTTSSTSTSTPAPGAAGASGTETDKDCGDLWWWRQASAYAVDNNVCAYSSVKGPGGGKATCHHRKNHGAAAATCAANGARLCNLAEVQGKVAAGSGCGIDGKLQWTGTACAKGFLAARGNGGGSAKCLAASSTSPSVRCCAE